MKVAKILWVMAAITLITGCCNLADFLHGHGYGFAATQPLTYTGNRTAGSPREAFHRLLQAKAVTYEICFYDSAGAVGWKKDTGGVEQEFKPQPLLPTTRQITLTSTATNVTQRATFDSPAAMTAVLSVLAKR